MMRRRAAASIGALLLAATSVDASPAGGGPPTASSCVEWRLEPAKVSSGAPKAVVGMADLGNLTVIDLAGDYDRNAALPRQQIAQAFLQGRGDDYDFLVVFTTFEFDTGGALAFYNPLRNDVRGIGQPVFDNGAAYGSERRLQGIVDMAAVSRHAFDPADPQHPQLLNTLAHELMHRWAVGVRYRAPDGTDRSDLIGRDGSHWSFFVDSDGSVMYGNDWQALPGGRFRSVRVRHQYSALDLYLGGFLGSAEVPPTSLLRGAPGDAASLPQLGAEITAAAESVTVGQIVAAEGVRAPSAADAPKSFRAGLLLLKRPGEALPANLPAQLERLRTTFQQRFTAMTGGRGTLRFGNLPRRTATPGLPDIVLPSALRGGDVQLQDGLAWLRARQHPDGRFEDDPGTVLRDTAYAVMAMSELSPGDPAIARARAFLATAPAATLEEHAWRAAGLPVDRAISLAAIERLGTTSEGFRLTSGVEPGLLDTQIAVDMLGREDPRPARWQGYVLASAAAQGSDGAFGVYPGGEGSLRSTVLAIANLAIVDPLGATATAIRERGRGWIVGRQGGEGGFGTSLSESLELLARQPQIALPETPYVRLRDWVRSRQGVAGDFGGSVYATSLALLALTRDGAPNLAISGAPRFDPGRPMDGMLVRLEAVVENRGGGPAPATLARFFNGPPDEGGLPIGVPVPVPALEPGGRSPVSTLLDTRGLAGERVIHVLADAGQQVAESSEADNGADATLSVAPAQPGVELAMSGAELTVVPAEIDRAPVEIVVSGVVRNLGAAPATGVLVRARIDGVATDVLAETRIDVDGRGSAPFELRFVRELAVGFRLRMEADADDRHAEVDEADNVVLRDVRAGAGVDLALPVGGIERLGDAAVAGRPVRFRVAVENRGASDAPPVTLAATVRQGGERFVLAPQQVQVAAGGRESRDFSWTPTLPGSALLEAEIDPTGAIIELDESNNTASLAFEVRSASGVNLTVADARLELSPLPPREGEPLRAFALLRNVGAEPAPSTVAALYAGDPRLAGQELARVMVPAIAAGASVSVELMVATLDLRGDTTFYLVADADRAVAESDEDDNLALRTVPVIGLADLSIALGDIELEPSRPVLGEPVTARLQVRNLGGQPTAAFLVRLTEIGVGAALVAPERTVDGLAPGAVAELSWNWTLGLDPAPRALQVEVDPTAAVAETREDNNCLELPLSLQDGTVFASQRWFSPDGDGVKDQLRVAWRLPAAEAVVVRVRSAGGRVLRRFPPTVLARGEVTWDGRNDRGRMVPDGDYRVELLGADERPIGYLEATVDTNRSTSVEAIDTPRARLVALPVAIPPDAGGWRFAPRGAATRFAVFARAARPPTGEWPPRFVGLYRSDTLFPGLRPVLSQDWLRRYATARGYYSGEVVDFWPLPDGQRIAFLLQFEIAFGPVHHLFGVMRADAVDNPELFGTPQAIPGGRPFVEGVLDADTLLVRWPAGSGPPRRLLDLRSGNAAPFAADVAPSAEVVRASANGVVFRIAESEGQGWHFAPRSGAPARDLGAWQGAVLSPDGRALAGLREDNAQQSVWLAPLDGAPPRPLVAIERQPFRFAPDDLRYPDQLTMAWVARAGELLVVDATVPRALTFTRAGEPLDAVALPVAHGPSEPADAGALWVGSADSVHLGRASMASVEGCEGASTWLAERAMHQWFDAASEELTLSIARTTAARTRDSESDELVPILYPSGLASVAIDLFSSVATPSEDMAPAWMFADGSRIDCDGSLRSAGGERLRERWDLARDVVDVSPDESTLLLARAEGLAGAQTGGRVLGSFLNLPVVLRAENLGRAIRLYGLVADRQLERWELEWAQAGSTPVWQSVTTASNDEVVADDFLYWTPPEPGAYLVRLRGVDRAGNVETSTVPVTSQFSADLGAVSAEPRALSPNGDGVQDGMRVEYVVRRPTTVRIEIRDASGMALRTFLRTVGETGLGPATWTWDGRDDGGSVVADGRYQLWINEQRLSLLVDTRAPTGAPLLSAPFDSPGRDAAELLLAPPGRAPLADENLAALVLESSEGGPWQSYRELPAGSVSFRVPLEDYAGRNFRLHATDRAGNRSLFTLGTAAAEITIVDRVGLWRPAAGGASPRIQRSGVSSNARPFTAPPEFGSRYLQSDPPDLDLIEVSSTLGDLVEIEYQTAALSNTPDWQVRGRVGIDGGGSDTCARIGVGPDRCPLTRPIAHWRHLDVIGDPAAVAEKRAFLVRVVGVRADGSRRGSNWIRFEPDGLDFELDCATGAPARDSLVPAVQRERLLRFAGLAPADASRDLRFAGFGLPAPDGLRSLDRLDIDGIVGAATVLAWDRDAALVRLTPAAVAAIDAAAAARRKALAVARITTLVDGSRASATEARSCAASALPPLPLQARVEPLVGAECAAAPSGAVQLGIGTTERNASATVRRMVVTLRDPATELEQQVLDRTFSPPLTVTHIEQTGEWFALETSGMPPGVAEARVQVDFGQGLVALQPVRFEVDHTAGAASISRPAAGARVCAVSESLDRPGPIVPIEGTVDGGNPGQAWYRLGVGEGLAPLVWRESDRGSPPVAPVNGPLGGVKVTQSGASPFEINGAATLRVRAWDWSGAQVCATQGVVVDSRLDAAEGASGEFGPVLGQTNFGPVLGLSGRGRFQQVVLPYQLGERVDFVMTLHALARAGEAGSALLDPPLATVQEGFSEPPRLRLAWDGALGGAPLDEGLYGLRLDLRDACGFTKRFEYRLQVDRTPPSVALTQPTAGARIGGLQIEVRGTADDPRLARWQVLAGPAAAGSALAPVGEGSAPVVPAARLAAWTRGGLSGPATIALLAEDALDNLARVDVRIELEPPSALVAAAAIEPPQFSPNGDGVKDEARIDVVFSRAVRADLRVIDASGAAQRVLAAGASLPAGAARWSWDGRGSGGSLVPDGAYRFELQVADALQPAAAETQLFAVDVDTEPPQLQPLPQAAFVPADRGVGASIADLRVEGYEVALRREDGGAEFAREVGTEPREVVLARSDVLDEVGWRLQASAVDRAGNRARLDHRLVVDRSPPAVDLVAPEDGSVLRRGASTAVAGGVEELHLDRWDLQLERAGSPAVPLAGGTSAPPTGSSLHAWAVQQVDGAARLVLTARDRAGNSARVERALVIDGTPPLAVITRPAAGTAIQRELRIEGTASDANFLRYRIALAPATGANAGQFSDLFEGEAAVVGGILFDATLSRAEGDYLLRLTVEDRAGLSSSATTAIRIDNEPPPAPTGLVATAIANRDVALDWDDVPAQDLARFRIYRNGVALVGEPAQSQWRDDLAPEGRLRYAVTALDRAGNESARSAAVEVVLDRTPPQLAILHPSDEATVAGNVVVRGRIAADGDLSQWRLLLAPDAGGAPAVLVEGAQEREDAVLADWDTRSLPDLSGHRLTLEAVDRSGNAASASARVQVDNGPPGSPTGLVATVADGDVVLDWDPNAESDLLGYLPYRDGLLLTAAGTPAADLRPYAITSDAWRDEDVGDGTRRYQVRAIDRAGNVSAPSTDAVVELDNTPPRLAWVEPLPLQAFERTIHLRAQSPDVDITQVVFAWRAPGGAWTPIGPPLTAPPWAAEWTPQGLAFGTYELRAVAREFGGREDPQPPLIAVRLADLTPPEPPGQVVARADGLRIRTSWTESPSADVAQYRVYRGAGAAGPPLATLPATGSEHEDDAQGAWDVQRTVVAVDAEGNVSAAPPPAQARIFAPQLLDPFTPVATEGLSLDGRSVAGGVAMLVATSTAGTVEQGPVAGDAEGRFIFADLPLGAGENRLVVRVTDADGNRSLPAETFVDRAVPPAAPAPVAVTLVERTASVAWTPSPEGGAVGFRVFRNGAPLLADEDTPGLSATAPWLWNPQRAVDDDPLTTVEIAPGFDGRLDSPITIELRAPAAGSVVGLRLLAADAARRIVDADVEAWSGRRWVRVAGFDGNADAERYLPLDAVYRTQRVRLVVRRVPPLLGAAIAEIDVVRRPMFAASPVALALPDGRHVFRVTAVDRFGFEGPAAIADPVEVGDAEPPAPVVLDGSVSGSDAVLVWSASASSDVAAYLVRRDGRDIARVPAVHERRHVDADRPDGAHEYTVVAVDAFDNVSVPSNPVRLTFAADRPGAPQWVSLQAPPEGRAAQLAWQAGAGAVPSDYVIERADATAGPFVALATLSATSFRDAPLLDGRTYHYRVLARDRAGNRGPVSEVRSVVPRDLQPPAPPSMSLPLPPGATYTTGATGVGVCGSAEPDARVELRSDRGAVAQARAAADWVARTLASGLRAGVGSAVSSDGRFLFVSEPGSGGEIHDLDGARLAARVPFAAQWATASPDARTLWYVGFASADIQRVDLQTLQASVFDAGFESIRALLAAPDGRALFAYGLRRGDTAEAAWLLDPLGGDPVRLGELGWYDIERRFHWSPDGTRVLVTSADQSAAIVFARDGSRQEAPIGIGATDARWLPDGRHLLWLENTESGARLREVELGTGSVRERLQFPVPVYRFVPDPTGRLVALQSAQRIDIVELDSGAILRTEPAADIAGWTAGHRLVLLADQVVVLEAPGSFCVRDFPLSAGVQSIRVTARDAAGNTGPASAPVTVQVASDDLPDLAIAPADLRALPAAGRVGDRFSALVTVRNRGAAAPSVPVTLVLGHPGGAERVLPAQALGALAAGAARTLEFPLGVLDAAGTWRLRVTVDAGNLVVERDESNNNAQRDVPVSATGAPLLELALRGDLLAPDQPLLAQVAVSNPGNPFDGRLVVQVLDATGDEVTELLRLPVAALGFAQRRSWDLAWPTAGRAGGEYRLRAVLRDVTDAVVASSSASFAIDRWQVVGLDLALPVDQVTRGTLLSTRARVAYRAGNAALGDALLALEAIASDGASVARASRVLGTLRPGFEAVVPFDVPTEASAAGPLRIVARLAAGGFETGAERSVLVADPVVPPVLAGTLELAPDAAVQLGRDAVLRWTVRNDGPTALPQVDARLRVLDETGSLVLERRAGGALPAGGSSQRSEDLAALGLSLRVYAALLEARLPDDAAGAWRLLAARSLPVTDGEPPTIDGVVPDGSRPVAPPLRASARVVDRHAGVDRVEWQVDDGPWQPMFGDVDGRYAATAPPLGDGVRVFRLRASDRYGNLGETAPRTVRIDGTPPTIAISGVVDGQIGNQDVVPSITIEDNHPDPAQDVVRLDGQTFVTGTPVSTEAAHVLFVRATDRAGNRSERTLRFSIDRTPPALAFASPLDGSSTNAATIDVRLVSEAGAQVELATGAYRASAVAGTTGEATFSGVPLQLGSNVLQARATDAAGNRGPERAVTVVRGPAGGAELVGTLQAPASVARGAGLTLVAQARNDSAVALAQQRLRVRALGPGGGALLASEELVRDIAIGATITEPLSMATASWPLGQATLVLDAQAGGAWQQLDAAVVQVVDGVAPQLLVLAPMAGAVLRNPLLVAATASDDGGPPPSVRARVDQGAWLDLERDPGDASRFVRTLAPQPEGTRLLDVEARDEAGNTTTAPPRAFVVDETPPAIVFGGIADGAFSNAASVVPTVTVADANPDLLTVTLDGLPWNPGTAVTAEGARRIEASAMDRAGNSATAVLHFTLDRTPPVVQFNAPPEGAVVALDRVLVSGQTEPLSQVLLRNGAFSVHLVADQDGRFVAPEVPLQVGDNTLTAEATDRAGNRGPGASRSVRFAPNAGAILKATMVAAPAEGEPGTTLRIDWTLRNAGSAPVSALPVRVLFQRVGAADAELVRTLDVSLSPGASVAGTADVSTAGRSLGSHEAIIEAQLATNEGSVAWTRLAGAAHDVVDRTPPQVAFLDPPPASVHGATVPVVVDARDALSDVAVVEARFAGGPWVTLAPQAADPQRFAGTLDALADGPTLLEARATDAAAQVGSATPRTVAIDRVPPQVSITNVPPEDPPVNVPVLPVVTVQDDTSVSSVITLDGQPFSAGMAVEADGPHVLRVVATDAADNVASAEARFTIDRKPPTVAIAQPPPGTQTAAAAILVAGQTEPRATVRIVVGTVQREVAADHLGAFSADEVPLGVGSNTIVVAARDRAGNDGPPASVLVIRKGPPTTALDGRIDLNAKVWEAGEPLPVPVTLRNLGSTDAVGARFRLLVETVDGGSFVAAATITADLAAGAGIVRQFDFATMVWPQTELRLRLQHDRANAGMPDWATLAQHLLVLTGRCFQAQLFADGFESGGPARIFGDGFEACIGLGPALRDTLATVVSDGTPMVRASRDPAPPPRSPWRTQAAIDVPRAPLRRAQQLPDMSAAREGRA